MFSEKSIGLYLTGGLGNQLFQFAAALSFSNKQEIEIFEKLGRPRLNQKGDPELFSLTVPQIASITRRYEDSKLLRKSSGYLLRSTIWPNNFERFIIFRFLVDLATSIIQTLSFGKLFYPISISDVGYQTIKVNKLVAYLFSPFLIGYFQSFIWPQEVISKLRSLNLTYEGPDLKRLKHEAESQPPVVIHVRRGDYKKESTFGLPGEKYYRDAMSIINRKYPTSPIWVFSDEEPEARKILNWLPSERVKYIRDVDGESAASLMAMRLGCAYVIANSTFSWWGAFLSFSDKPLVVTPKPWFIGQDEPKLLIPIGWYRIDY